MLYVFLPDDRKKRETQSCNKLDIITCNQLYILYLYMPCSITASSVLPESIDSKYRIYTVFSIKLPSIIFMIVPSVPRYVHGLAYILFLKTIIS